MMKKASSKIKTINELEKILNNLKKKGKRIVHCHGVFDLIHPGHLKHFEAAKRKGDVLVVTLTRDEYVNRGPGRPIFNHDLRAESLAAIECIDFVAINEWPTAVETIKKLRPDFYVKGKDYLNKEDDVTGKIYDEEMSVKSVGGVLHFTDEITFSSSSIINAFFNSFPEEAKVFLADFKKRHSADEIINRFKRIRDFNILVIGDIIIDEYHYCMGMGKSQKDNLIATKYLNEETFAGGVLAAANHLSGFCNNVTLISCIGTKNSYSEFIANHTKPNIKTNFYVCKDKTTVVKRRFVDPNFLSKLFEICYLDEANLMPLNIENEILSYLKKNLKHFDMVLVADFGHGVITPKIVQHLSREARFLAVNVQTNSSNIGFNLITKFPKAGYICIDEPEIRLATHDRVSNLEKLILRISNKLDCQNIIITRGHKGSLAYSKSDDFAEIPVFSKEVVDRIGAGDAYFSITSPCVCAKIPMELVGFIGNAVGALKVLIVGNRSPVEPAQLFKYISTLLK